MITRFWWVRHGPTHAKTAVGHLDLPADLSDTAALARLAAYLPDPAVIVSSDLQRASATADAIQGNRTRLPHSPTLREMDFGDWDGVPFDQVAKRDPELSRACWDTPGDVAPPNGEIWNELSARIQTRTTELAAEHAGKDIVIVAHFAVILSALQNASNIAATSAMRFKVDNLSVTQLEYLHSADSWRVIGVNHTP